MKRGLKFQRVVLSRLITDRPPMRAQHRPIGGECIEITACRHRGNRKSFHDVMNCDLAGLFD